MHPPVTTRPPLLHEVATIIKQSGNIWSIEQVPAEGTLFRCEINRFQFRVFVPRYGKPDAQMPVEKGSPGHLVTTLDNLNTWLREIQKNR